jgi:hypothetical protein
MTRFEVLNVNGNNVTKGTLLNRCEMSFVIASIVFYLVVDRPMAGVVLLISGVQRLLK